MLQPKNAELDPGRQHILNIFQEVCKEHGGYLPNVRILAKESGYSVPWVARVLQEAREAGLVQFKWGHYCD